MSVWLVIQAMSDDDDIIAGPQKMSLKCPVSVILPSWTHVTHFNSSPLSEFQLLVGRPNVFIPNVLMPLHGLP